jgi:hypothetical protein
MYTRSGHSRSRRFAAAALVTGVLMTAGLAAPADAAGNAHGKGKQHCRALHGTATGTDNGDGTTSATLYQGKREAGHVAGSLATGVPGPDGLLPFSGVIVLDTWKGALEAEVEGTFDTVTGAFSARTQDLAGKGALRNASGRLRITGLQDLATGQFTEVVHARVCVPKKHQH